MLDPAMRASDSDRDSVRGVIQNAEADGRLTAEETASRVERVQQAKTYGELDELVGDLTAVLPSEFLDPAGLQPGPPAASNQPPSPGQAYPGQAYPGQAVEPVGPGVPVAPQRFAASGYTPDNPLVIDPGWSSEKKKGHWTLPPFLTIHGSAGSVHLDCTEANVETEIVNIEISGGMGSVTLVVPHGWGADTMRVTKSMGTLTNKVEGSHTPGMPLLQLFGKMGIGSLTIRHMDWLERRRYRKRHQLTDGSQMTSLPPDPERRELR